MRNTLQRLLFFGELRNPPKRDRKRSGVETEPVKRINSQNVWLQIYSVINSFTNSLIKATLSALSKNRTVRGFFGKFSQNVVPLAHY